MLWNNELKIKDNPPVRHIIHGSCYSPDLYSFKMHKKDVNIL